MRATVAFNRSLSPAYLHLGIAAPGFPVTFRAGEFVMVRPAWIGDPFLPRAFSIYRISSPPPASGPSSPIVEVLYKVLGKGTQCLARMEPGQEVEILGPLGYSRNLLLEKWMRDAKINDIFEGTQQINMMIIARRILGYSSKELS